MECPCCNNKINKLKLWNGFVKCVRNHLFKVELREGRRIAVVQQDAPEEGGCRKGQEFPIPEDETF